MAAVAQLKAVVSMDTKAYKAGAKDIQRQNQKMRSQMQSVGSAIGISFGAAAAVAAVMKIGRAIKDWADDASIAARKVGILTSEMIALRRIAIQSGSDLGQMQRVLAKLQSELFRAATGTETSAEKFEALGLSVDDLTRMDPSEMFEEVAKAASDANFPLGEMIELFGEKLGPNAMIVLKEIAQNGLGPLNDALGVTADKVEALGSQWAKWGDQAKGATTGVMAALGEYHAMVVDFVSGTLSSQNFADEDEGVIPGLTNVKKGRARRKAEIDAMTEDRKKEQAESIKQVVKARVDSLTKQLSEEEAKMATALERVQGRGRTGRPEAAGLERVGASFGNRREGLPVAERQLAISERQLEVMRTSADKLDGIREELATARGNLPR